MTIKLKYIKECKSYYELNMITKQTNILDHKDFEINDEAYKGSLKQFINVILTDRTPKYVSIYIKQKLPRLIYSYITKK